MLMKRDSSIWTVFVTTLLLAACTAALRVKRPRNMRYIQKGEYEKFADAIALDEKATPEDNKKNQRKVVALLKEKGAQSIEEKRWHQNH
jgi:hypothetical protein